MNTVQSNRADVIPVSEGYQPNPTEVDAAAQYADYTVDVRYGSLHSERFGELDARRYRWAGEVRILPNEQRFVLVLDPGSRAADLAMLQLVVRDVRAGAALAWPWREQRSKEGKTISYSTVPGYSFREEVKLGGWIVPCRTEGCVEFGRHHLEGSETSEEDVLHRHIDSLCTDGYALEIFRLGADPWGLAVEVPGELEGQELARFVNDTAWLAETVKRANASGVSAAA